LLETRIWTVGAKDGVDEIIFQTIVPSDQRVALSVVVLGLPPSQHSLANIAQQIKWLRGNQTGQ
jgi:hypothetical protein